MEAMESNTPLTRRAFAALAAFAPLARSADSVAFYDYHVHLGGPVTLDKALAISKQRGVPFGIVEHAGKKENAYSALISDDAALKAYLSSLQGFPVMKGIQAEGMDWMACFSKGMIARLDYVLSDALTMPQKNGKLERIWLQTFTAPLENKQDWMDRYTDFNVRVMAEEPIDIIANPTFLPTCIEKEYDSLWTRERMKRVIDAAVKYNVAIEINSRYRVPSLAFLKMAKAARVKFSFGSNYHGTEVGDIGYCREMAQALALTPRDVFRPAPAGRKPVEIRTFPPKRGK